MTVTEPLSGAHARVLLHQKPHIHYRNWDGLVFRDGEVAGHLREVGEGYEAFARRGGRLGDGDTIAEALDLFDQDD